MSILRGLFSAGNAQESGQHEFKDLSELNIPPQIEDALSTSPAMQYQAQQNSFYNAPFVPTEQQANLGFPQSQSPTMFGQDGIAGGVMSLSPALRKANVLDGIGGNLMTGNYNGVMSSLLGNSSIGGAINAGSSLMGGTTSGLATSGTAAQGSSLIGELIKLYAGG